MQDAAIEFRPDGSVSIFVAGRQYRREPHNERWVKRTPSGYGDRPVSDRRARWVERIYRHSDEIKRIRRFPRLEPALKPGLPVYHPAFGSGDIAAIEGEKILVKFGEHERQVRAQDLVTRDRAEVDWYRYWRRGAERRFEEGKRLWIVKSLCRHGEWQAFLNRYRYPRSTADDLIKRYRYEVKMAAQHRQLHGYRAIDLADADGQVNESTFDREAEEREELVAKENDKRRGRMPHSEYWSIRIKLPPDVGTRCREKYKEEPDAAKEYWQAAAYIFVGLDPDAPDHNSHSRGDESESSQ